MQRNRQKQIFAGERRRRSLKETGFREDGTGDRSIKSTGSGKKRRRYPQSSKHCSDDMGRVRT